MPRRSTPPQFHQPDFLTLAAGTWLACGVVLFGLTPLPLHDVVLGWSPAFWLVLAPAMMLCARLLSTPRRLPRGIRSVNGERACSMRRRDASMGLFTPMREHTERRRHATRRVRQAG